MPDRLTGSLHVTRNPTKSIFSNTSGGAGDVWVDEKDGNGRYKWTLYEDFLTKSEQAAPHLLAAAKQFPCIAYSIEYDITLESHSKILDCDKATSRTYFYPFSRRFYHRSENLLDRALYQYMVLLALGKEYEKPSEAFTVFSAWFKTLLLPKELLKPFKSDTTGPLASTNGPLASTNMSGGSSLFSQYINPTSTSIANAMSMLNFSKIPTNSHF